MPDGRVIIVGGQIHDHFGPRRSDVEAFDPATHHVARLQSLPVGRGWHSAIALADGRLLVAGGEIDGRNAPTNTALLYEPSEDRWTPAGRIPQACNQPMLASLPNGTILVAGGDLGPEQGETAAAAVFDATTRGWTRVRSMPYARAGSLVPLPDGRLVAVGGTLHLYGLSFSREDGTPAFYDGRFASFDVFDPATRRWSTTDIAHVPWFPERVVPLSDGLVLVAGERETGQDGTRSPHAEIVDASGRNVRTPRQPPGTDVFGATERVVTFESGPVDGRTMHEWLPHTDTWRVAARLSRPRAAFTVTVVDGGRSVVIAGGFAGNDPSADVEVCSL